MIGTVPDLSRIVELQPVQVLTVVRQSDEIPFAFQRFRLRNEKLPNTSSDLMIPNGGSTACFPGW